MQSQKPKRASSLKALKAIQQNGKQDKQKERDIENLPLVGGIKRRPSPTVEPPLPKRNALKNITNTNLVSEPLCLNIDKEPLVYDEQQPLRRSKRLLKKSSPSPVNLISDELMVCTPITTVQSGLEATSLDDSSKSSLEDPESPWVDIDQAEAHDPFFSSEYAASIYIYMKQREDEFVTLPYLDSQPLINSSMRTILIDWLVEVQENFELFHETLYLAVKIVDRYLEKTEVKKEYLQLVGATAMLIAAKYEELNPPLVDDFIYLCDDAYQHDELLTMERNILSCLDYDINTPIAYRFLRRLARAANADMETHTLARYISESTLQEYDFVSEKPSLIAAASMYLAIRMKDLGAWTPTLQHYSGYTVSELLPLATRLNDLISKPIEGTTTVRSKYSHEVFYKVAMISPLLDVYKDSQTCLTQMSTLF